MKFEIDTHTHTLVSGHAYNTMREMVQAAREAGLKGLAITEHAPGMEGTTHIYYFHNLRIVPREMYGVKLLLGAELNISDEEGSIDLDAKALSRVDITIASIHVPCYHGGRDKASVTRAYVNAMKNPDVDIIGHPDDGRYVSDYEVLARVAKETGTLLELNNSSLTPGCGRTNTRENDIQILKACMKYGTMITVGTDSHIDVTVGKFDYANQLLQELSFPEELIANCSLDRFLSCLKRNRS